jgi:hypothetical protein
MISPMPVTVEWTMKRRRAPKQKPTVPVVADQERIPRIARLMALAIKFDALIRQGVVRDYADLARLGHVSRARATQIMDLLHLAPDIQEQLINLRSSNGSVQNVCERHLRKMVRVTDWSEQRQFWKNILCAELADKAHQLPLK